MVTKRIQEFRFFFKKESIVMLYHGNYTCFHCFGSRNKSHLRRFGENIFRQKTLDINEVYRLANEHKVDSMYTTGPPPDQWQSKLIHKDGDPRRLGQYRISW